MEGPKIHIRDIDDEFNVVILQGNHISLDQSVKLYLASGNFKESVDFSPVVSMTDNPNALFLAANIYGPKFCSFTATNYPNYNPESALICSGIEDLPYEFLMDFVEVTGFDPIQESTTEFIEKSIQTQFPLYTAYLALSRARGKDFAGNVMSDSLRQQQQKYIRLATDAN